MSGGLIHITFFDVEPPKRSELVETVLTASADIGFSGPESDTPVDPDTYETTENGNVRVYNGTEEIALDFFLEEHSGSEIGPFLKISMDTVYFPTESGKIIEDTDNTFWRLLRLVEILAAETDPPYVGAFNSEVVAAGVPTDGIMPDQVPIELEQIPWLGVYSDQLIEEFGGRDHVLETPAWKVEELDTGSVLIVKSQVPWEDTARDQPVDEHLLGE